MDRAALDAAMGLDLACGGWCPARRRAEDGAVPACYPLRETESADYRVRTERNVLESDGTLILTTGPVLRGGTALTRRLARLHRRPWLVVDLHAMDTTRPKATIEGLANRVRAWRGEHRIAVLNVAGPRESQSPGIYALARRLLHVALAG